MTCLCTKSRVLSPALHELGVVTFTCNLSSQVMENQKFKIIPSYLLNTIVQVPIEYKSPSKNNKQTKLKTDKKKPQNIKIPFVYLSNCQNKQLSWCISVILQFRRLRKEDHEFKTSWVTEQDPLQTIKNTKPQKIPKQTTTTKTKSMQKLKFLATGVSDVVEKWKLSSWQMRM